MKKIYTIVTALFISATSMAQVVDFEAFSLAPETFDNGSGLGGDFYLTPFYFNNSYDTVHNSWSGFSISNTTDVTTPGWTNQYSAYPGSGANSSSNYAMGYWNPEIWGSGNERIDSLKITTSTYGYLSMLNGDGYGKEFGSPLDGNGNADGTNGEDFFMVWIYCEDGSGNNIDSVEYFLADYRFMDDNDDYIVDKWVNIDLTSIPFDVQHVYFKFKSSDNDPVYGMKTPAYIAIDDIHYQSLQGVNEIQAASYNVYPNPVVNELTVQGDAAELNLFSSTGRLVYSLDHINETILNMEDLPSGMYMLQMKSETGISTVKILK